MTSTQEETFARNLCRKLTLRSDPSAVWPKRPNPISGWIQFITYLFLTSSYTRYTSHYCVVDKTCAVPVPTSVLDAPN